MARRRINSRGLISPVTAGLLWELLATSESYRQLSASTKPAGASFRCASFKR